MEKAFFFTLIIIGLLFAATVRVDALTEVSLNLYTVSIVKGKPFTLTVVLDPSGVENHKAQVELQYPADLLEVRSFTFEDPWIPILRPDSDLIDNTNGVLLKTGEYPGGVSLRIPFGKASFLAKETGKGVIQVGANSSVLDENNQNVIDPKRAETLVEVIEKGVLPEEPPIFDIIVEPAPPEEPLRVARLLWIIGGVALIILSIFTIWYVWRRRRRLGK